MAIHIRRRELIAALGCTAAWPVAARAQQGAEMRRVGVLMSGDEVEPGYHSQLAAFVQGLRGLGWTDGQNIRLDVRWNGGDAARARSFATELLRLSPDVILASSTPNLTALLRQGPVMPVVFLLVSDPIGQGFVSNLAQPGGNITGFSQFEFSIGGKWIELLKQMVPGLARVTMMYNPDTSPSFWLSSFEAAAPSLGVEVTAAPIHSTADIEPTIGTTSRQRNSGLIVPTDTFLRVNRRLLVESAARHRVPALYSSRDFTEMGGLISYEVDAESQFKQAAVYVDRILHGAKPGSLPVQFPTKFELVINLKTAKALELSVPASLIATADEVIE